MKNFKKLISAISALSVTVTAFAGLSITAEAALATTPQQVAPSEVTYIASATPDTPTGANPETVYANMSKIQGGVFIEQDTTNNPAQVALIKFDAGEYAGRIKGGKINLTATCTVATKNSNVQVAAIGTAWSADTITWNAMADEAAGLTPITYVGDLGYATDAGLTGSVDVSDVVRTDEDGTVAFGIYTATGRQQAITDLSLTLDVTENPIEYTSVTINKMNGEEILETVSVDNIMVGDTFTASGDAVTPVVKDGVTYIMDASANITIDSVEADAVLNLPYAASAGNMVLSENFDALTDTWGFTTDTGVAAGDGVLNLCTANGSLKTDTKTFDETVTGVRYANVKFDWKTGVDLNSGSGRSSYFALTDGNNNTIFGIRGAANRAQLGYVKVGYGYNDELSSYVALADNSNNDFYTIDLTIDFINKKLNGTIVNSAGDNVGKIENQAITADSLAGLKAVNAGSLAPMAIDNFSVMALDMPAVNFTVKNDKGEVVEGALIKVLNESATAAADGTASINLPAGTYTAEVSAPKHQPKEVQITVEDGDVDSKVILTYVGETTPARVELSGGSEKIYKPAEGTNSTEAFTAVIYDNVEQIMTDEAVVWSLPNNKEAGLSIENGVLSVTSELPLTDINGIDVVVRAASATDPTVYAEKTVHINDVAKLNSFAITGAKVIKDGKTAEYTITDPKDQYGEAFTGSVVPVFTTDNEAVTFDGATMSAATGTSTMVDVVVTATVGETKATKTVTVYGYDYYEPGKGEATYGTPRMENVNDVSTVVWPASGTANATTTITLPEPVALTPGTAKMITFKNTWINQTVGSQDRRLDFKNSAETTILSIGFAGANVVTDYAKVDGSFTGTKIGILGAAGAETEATFILKTDAAGVTTADLMYNGDSISITLGEGMTDIASYALYGGKGAPDDRLLTMSDVRISDSDVKMVEISGAENVARISGKTAKSQYKASIFSQAEGENYVWSVTGAEGITIDENGVLSVAETVAPETVVTVSCTSDKDATKTDSKTVTIKDYARVQSYEIEGPTALDAGSTASYKVVNIVDEYGAIVDMPVSFAIKSGSDVASITENGVITGKTSGGSKTETKTVSKITGNAVKYIAEYNADNTLKSVSMEDLTLTAGEEVDVTAPENSKVFVWDTNMRPALETITVEIPAGDGEPIVGDVVIAVTIGNPDKTEVAEKTVKFVKSMITGDAASNETKVDVTSINGYAEDITYRVTVLKNDGTYTITDDVAAANGVVTIDTTDAAKYEVSPIFTKANVGDARGGVEFAVTDGRYDVTVKKSTGNRGDITANGLIIGQNVDQYGAYRAPSGSVYTAKDVVSTGGNLVIATAGTDKDGYLLDYITVKKAPSIIERKQHVYVLGDSLVSTYYGDLQGETNSQTGWGQVLDTFISDDVNVTNLAESGNYAKGLYDSVFKTVMAMAQPGDVLLFECGYNDRNYPSELAEAARVELMKDTMQQVFDESAAKGINLTFVTPNASTHGTAWKAQVQKAGDVIAKCTDMKANLIDLSGQSFKYISSCGATEDEAKAYTLANFMATGDQLHSSYFGAMMHAGIVAQGLTALGGDFAKVVDTNATVTINDTNGNPVTLPVTIPAE